MGALLFGEKFKCIDEDDCELAKAIAAFMKGTSELLFVPFPYYKYITTPTAKAMHDCLATIKRLGIERIKNKRQQLKNGTLASTKSDFLSLLLTTTDENGQLLSVSEMLADLFDTMVAGKLVCFCSCLFFFCLTFFSLLFPFCLYRSRNGMYICFLQSFFFSKSLFLSSDF